MLSIIGTLSQIRLGVDTLAQIKLSQAWCRFQHAGVTLDIFALTMNYSSE